MALRIEDDHLEIEAAERWAKGMRMCDIAQEIGCKPSRPHTLLTRFVRRHLRDRGWYKLPSRQKRAMIITAVERLRLGEPAVGDRIHCEGCAYYEPTFSGIGGVGECRRHPPTIVNDSDFAEWPNVRASDWCGEAQPPAGDT